MRYAKLLFAPLVLLVTNTDALAQADGLVAYVPARPIERTADTERIGFMDGAVGGKAEAVLPADAYQADILNARGNVVRSYMSTELETLSLSDLRPGTWTLRVHTPTGFLVRRFVVMTQGAAIWSPDRGKPARKRRR